MKWTKKEVFELKRCMNDPLYFIQNFVWMNADEGIIQFNPFPYQVEIINKIIEGNNVLVLKARRVGLSWIASSIIAWIINFNPGEDCLMQSRTETEAIGLLSKVKFILKNLFYKDSNDYRTATPASFLCGSIVKNNQSTLSVGFYGKDGDLTQTSSAFSLTTTKHSGRGSKARFVFVDEAAFIENQDEVFASVLTTGTRAGSWMIGSSAGDVGTRFHYLALKGRAGENKSYWYREVWPQEAEITEEMMARTTEAISEEQRRQEWELQFRQPGNPVFEQIHLAACYKPLDMYPEITDELNEYRESVSAKKRWYYSGVDSALGKVHRRTKERDYNVFTALTDKGIQAFTYCDKKPLSTWAGESLNDRTVKPGKVSTLHAEFPGLCSIEDNGPGTTVLSMHFMPDDGRSEVRSITTTQKSKSRLIRNLIILIESHAITITDEKTYQQLTMYQFGKSAGSYEAAPGFHDDHVMALALAADGLMLEGGYEIDLSSLRPNNERLALKTYQDLADGTGILMMEPASPVIKGLPGHRASYLLPRLFENDRDLLPPDNLADLALMDMLYKGRKIK